jgi:uncharacterized protein YjcR
MRKAQQFILLDKNKEEIKSYYEDGMAILKIAKRYECTPCYVSSWLETNGLKRKSRKPFKLDKYKNEIKELLASGESKAYIIKTIGCSCSRTTLDTWLNANGLSGEKRKLNAKDKKSRYTKGLLKMVDIIER